MLTVHQKQRVLDQLTRFASTNNDHAFAVAFYAVASVHAERSFVDVDGERFVFVHVGDFVEVRVYEGGSIRVRVGYGEFPRSLYEFDSSSRWLLFAFLVAWLDKEVLTI